MGGGVRTGVDRDTGATPPNQACKTHVAAHASIIQLYTAVSYATDHWYSYNT